MNVRFIYLTIFLSFTLFVNLLFSQTGTFDTVKSNSFRPKTTECWEIKKNGEHLDIVEPEESNKVWARFEDDYALRLMGTPNLILDNGKIGIKTTHLPKELNVGGTGDAIFTSEYPMIYLWDSTADAYKFGIKADIDELQFHTFNPDGSWGGIPMRMYSNGDFAMGKRYEDTKLSVEGTITAKKVEVTISGWPDFVFKDEYKLMPLNDVKKYINKNNHLPDIPSEEELMKTNVDIGKMQSKFLQKIEELTLYLIEQNDKIEQREETIKALETRIMKLENKL